MILTNLFLLSEKMNLRFIFFNILFCLMLFGINVKAQESGRSLWKVTGKVLDSKGNTLPGVTIQVKGTTRKAGTGADGSFSIEAAPNSTLLFTYVGFLPRELVVSTRAPLKVVLNDDVKQLNEVVVTALGLTRQRKELGYAVGEVSGEELNKAKEINVINNLAAKVPGLVISQTAGGPSGSSRVIIRGSTELTGNNQPLYVVDGVPLDNTNFGSASTYGGYDLGDGISSINPEDVENISVLKGPAAAALYGSRASHGVVLITTKKAGGRKGLGIEFTSTNMIEKQLTKYDDIQTTYGQGSSGLITGIDDSYTSSKNWGPKIDTGLYITYFDGVKRPYKFIPNNIDGFFRTGLTTTNTLVMNSVKENTGFRLSYSNMYNRDIVPNTGMNRNSITLRSNTRVGSKLDVDAKINYVNESVNNRPALSGHRANVGTNLISLATTFDQEWLKNSYRTAEGDYYDWNNHDVYNLNPYWIINEMNNNSDKNRFSGTAILKYKLTDKLQARLTGGAEFNYMDFQEFAPPTTPGYESGYLQNSTFKNFTYNTELLLTYSNQFKSFHYGVNAGANIFYVNNSTDIVTAKQMEMRETVALQSFTDKQISEDVYRKQINSAFAMANLSYKDMVFIDATLRADKSSTLPVNHNTYVYPSVSGSFLVTRWLNQLTDVISFAKLRASFAQVGNDTSPYRLGLQYAMLDKPYTGYSFARINNSEIPSKNLKPTRTNSAELGTELKLLKDRIGLDVTYYTQTSVDQIMRLNTTISSGYDAMIVNAGSIENKGWEIALNTQPLKLKDFGWDLNLNFARNRNKVTELAPGITNFDLEAARWLDLRVAAVVGEDYGALMGRDFKKNENGDVIIDGTTGLPVIGDDMKVLGNATWDWTGGLNTRLRYKSFVLSGIVDVKMGADLYSMSARSFYMTGKSKETLEGRDEWYRSEEQRLEAGKLPAAWTPTGGYLAKGVVQSADAQGNVTYTPNNRYINPEDYWKHVANYNPAAFIFDNSYVKVREITLSYAVPRKLIRKFASDMSLSFVARNPFIIYKNIENIDPDSNYNNGSGMGLEFGSLPSRRSFGFNLNVKF